MVDIRDGPPGHGKAVRKVKKRVAFFYFISLVLGFLLLFSQNLLGVRGGRGLRGFLAVWARDRVNSDAHKDYENEKTASYPPPHFRVGSGLGVQGSR